MEIFTPGGPPSIHSYDPGYITGYPDGVFWIEHIPSDSVETHLGDGTASLQLQDVPVNDWITAVNSLSNGTQLGGPADATMSLDMQWSGTTRTVEVSDKTNGYSGKFLEDTATISISVQNSDGSFSFSGSGDSSSCFAEIGKERNGVFFSGEDEEDD